MDQGKFTVSPLYLYNGKLLVVDGKLATGQNCCCDEDPPPEPSSEPPPPEPSLPALK